MDKKICPACHTPFKVIYYQRRAADEPPDQVVYCNNCPVDTSKLSISSDINFSPDLVNIKPDKRKVKHNQSLSFNKTTYNKERRTMLIIKGAAAQRCYNSVVQFKSVSQPIIIAVKPIKTLHSSKVLNVHLSSALKGKAILENNSITVAPFITLSSIDIYVETISTKESSTKVVNGYEYNLESIPGTDHTVLRVDGSYKRPQLLILVNQSLTDNNLFYLSLLEQILVRYGTENNIKSFIDSRLISALHVQSARAFDWTVAPIDGYSFTWKPDGERFWYVKYGLVWIFCRRLLSGRITGWNICKSFDIQNTLGPILDVEVMIGHIPILIDVLVLESGIPTSPLRSLNDIIKHFLSMKSISVPIYLRQYFRTEKELLATKDKLQYPVDGIVGVEDGGTTIIKLKTTKSIELQLKDNGQLVSAEGTVVAQSELQNIYPINSIIELRFSKNSATDKPEITESLLRTDKTRANQYSVCQEIMRITTAMPETLARRRALNWCNSVRQKIHQIATKIGNKGRVILDIGAGDGQAISDYNNSPEVTYILVEPSKDKCNKLCRRLSQPGRQNYTMFQKAEEIGKAISSVSKGATKYAIICSTIEDILNQQQSIKLLKGCIKCCIASFSISYIQPALCTLALEGLEIIGCGYFYDGIGIGQSLINRSGVTMKVVSETMASVKWGIDKQYTEPCITTKAFNGILYKKHANLLVSAFKDNEDSLLNDVSSKVYTVSTQKNI